MTGGICDRSQIRVLVRVWPEVSCSATINAVTGPRPSDDDLLAAGDEESYALFYQRHVDWVLGFLARRTRDPELAADITAEVFAAALIARHRFRPRDGTANTWLFRIASNRLADAMRRGQAETRARRRLEMQPVLPTPSDIEMIEALAADLEVLAVVDELAPEQRAAVRARVLDERGYDEIAADLGVSEAVVRKRVSRGLGALRDRLGGRP